MPPKKGKTTKRAADASEEKDSKKRKVVCAVSRKDFLKNAKDIKIDLDGKEIVLKAKEFTTGSFGWTASGKKDIEVGDDKVKVQISINLSVLGSKET